MGLLRAAGVLLTAGAALGAPIAPDDPLPAVLAKAHALLNGTFNVSLPPHPTRVRAREQATGLLRPA